RLRRHRLGDLPAGQGHQPLAPQGRGPAAGCSAAAAGAAPRGNSGFAEAEIIRGQSPNYFLKSPAVTTLSFDGSMYFFIAAFTCSGVSAAILDSRSMSQAKVRLMKR